MKDSPFLMKVDFNIEKFAFCAHFALNLLRQTRQWVCSHSFAQLRELIAKFVFFFPQNPIEKNLPCKVRDCKLSQLTYICFYFTTKMLNALNQSLCFILRYLLSIKSKITIDLIRRSKVITVINVDVIISIFIAMMIIIMIMVFIWKTKTTNGKYSEKKG